MRTLTLLGCLALLAAPALAKGKVTPPIMVKFEDAQAQVRFFHPKNWTSITISDDGSKAEARTGDGQTKLTIEAVVKPKEGGVSAVLERRLPGGRASGEGEWRCVEGDIEGGKRAAAFCGKRMKNGTDLLIVGVTAPGKSLEKMGGRSLVVTLGKAAGGFRPAAEEQ